MSLRLIHTSALLVGSMNVSDDNADNDLPMLGPAWDDEE